MKERALQTVRKYFRKHLQFTQDKMGQTEKNGNRKTEGVNYINKPIHK